MLLSSCLNTEQIRSAWSDFPVGISYERFTSIHSTSIRNKNRISFFGNELSLKLSSENNDKYRLNHMLNKDKTGAVLSSFIFRNEGFEINTSRAFEGSAVVFDKINKNMYIQTKTDSEKLTLSIENNLISTMSLSSGDKKHYYVYDYKNRSSYYTNSTRENYEKTTFFLEKNQLAVQSTENVSKSSVFAN